MFPGMGGMGMGVGAGAGAGAGAGEVSPEQQQVQEMTKFVPSPPPTPQSPHQPQLTTPPQMERAMESCPLRTALAGGAGFALGGVFGLFMASMSYDTPMHLPGSTTAPLTSLPLRQQVRLGLKDMGARSFSSAKNFGIVGTIFAGTECCIESLRARHDAYNAVSSGCITGGILAKSAGPKAAAVGCAGFAAFSAAIEYYMNHME